MHNVLCFIWSKLCPDTAVSRIKALSDTRNLSVTDAPTSSPGQPYAAVDVQKLLLADDSQTNEPNSKIIPLSANWNQLIRMIDMILTTKKQGEMKLQTLQRAGSNLVNSNGKTVRTRDRAARVYRRCHRSRCPSPFGLHSTNCRATAKGGTMITAVQE